MMQRTSFQAPVARACFLDFVRAGIRAGLIGLLLVVLGSTTGLVPLASAVAKTPGKTYCFKRKCHRVMTIAETRREIGRRRALYASHYSHCKVDRFNPRGLTSSGERFRPGAPDNAASPIYPDGTKLLVWNPTNGKTVIVRINNAGPYWGRRKLDLSRAAAEKLGFRRRGVARLIVKVLAAPTRREARYRRGRRYEPVPGYIGVFGSIDTALRDVGRALDGLFGVSGQPATAPKRRRGREYRITRRKWQRYAKNHGRRVRLASAPPPPAAKREIVTRPALVMANAELAVHERAFGAQIALPTRPPFPPLPIAGLGRNTGSLRKLAAKSRKVKRVKLALAQTRRRSSARSRSRATRSAASRRRARSGARRVVSTAKRKPRQRLAAAVRLRHIKKRTKKIVLAKATRRKQTKSRSAAIRKTGRRSSKPAVQVKRKLSPAKRTVVRSVAKRSVKAKAARAKVTGSKVTSAGRKQSKPTRRATPLPVKTAKSAQKVRVALRSKQPRWKLAVSRGARD